MNKTACADCQASIARKMTMMQSKGWTVARDRCPSCGHGFLVLLRRKEQNN